MDGYEAIRKQFARELDRLETESVPAFKRHKSTDEYVEALVCYFAENEYDPKPILNLFWVSQSDTFQKTITGIALPTPMRKLWTEYLDFEVQKETAVSLQQFEPAAKHHYSAKTTITRVASLLQEPLVITPENIRDALRERGVSLPDSL